MTGALIGVGVALLLNILGFSFWLGRLSSKVDNLANHLTQIQKDITEMRDNTADLASRLSYIDGRLKERD